VLAVAVVGATLLGTFQLLLVTSEHRALDVALDGEPAQTREIDAHVGLVDATRGVPVLQHATAAFDEVIGDVPADRSTWMSSAMYAVAGTADPEQPYVYLASYPPVPANSRVVAGAMPTAATDAQGRVQVAVPLATTKAYGWDVGSVLHVTRAGTQDETTFVVTGTFELTGPKQIWTRDELQGAGHEPSYPVVGSAGARSTQAWGPLVTVPETFTAGKVALSDADLVALPHLGALTPAQLSGLRSRLADADGVLAAATKDDLVGVYVRSPLPEAIDRAAGDLQVTRIGLLIVELMLVAVAVTVLLLAARLLAERRAAEQTLMASRGASGRQILVLAVLEALGVAAVTTLVSPWLASWLYRAITSRGVLAAAGLHDDPGLPLSLWLACAVAALVLAAVLLGPVLRRRGSVVDAEQQLVRQDARGGIARTGADLALVVLAAVALHQLQSYHSPVVSGVGGIGSVDPVLVLAPALVLLAGAVVALRVMPLVARLGERLAARSRALVGSLAAWEVGRRPGRAAGAVLLLTLVVGVGSFAQTFLGTWRASQQDQADLAIGTDVRVVPELATPLEETAAISDVPGVRLASPVVDRTVGVGTGTSGSVTSTTLLGIDTAHADELLRGRVDGSWGAVTDELAPDAHLAGAPVPGSPTELVLDIRSHAAPRLDGVLYASLVVQDRLGAQTALDLPTIPVDTGAADVVVKLPAVTSGLQIVGLRVLVAPDARDQEALGLATLPVRLTVGLENVRAVTGDVSTPVPLGGARWIALGRAAQDLSGSLVTLTPQRDSIDVVDLVEPSDLLAGGQGFVVVGSTDRAATLEGMPVLATPGMLDSLGADLGDRLQVDLGGATVGVEIVGTVSHLPGEPHEDGMLVDSVELARNALVAGSVAPLADQWWLQVRDADATSVVAALGDHHVGKIASRAAARTDATDGPLHIGIQAALWIVMLAALALAVAGFAMSTTVAVRTRRLELARLQAIGVPRRGLVRSVLTEYAIVGALGLVAGLVLGTLLGARIAPLVTVSASGAPPVPAVVVQWSWPAQAALVGALVVLVAGVVVVTTNALLRRASGELLRLGDER
jgi:hypothetical protein